MVTKTEQTKTESKTENVAPAGTTASANAPAGQDLSIADLKNLGTIIDVASTRGAFRAGEMATVGAMYNKLQAFIAKVSPADKARATAGTTAGATAPVSENK